LSFGDKQLLVVAIAHGGWRDSRWESCNEFLHTAPITVFIGAYWPPTTNVWLTLTRVQHKSSLQVRLTPNHIAYESARLAICARRCPIRKTRRCMNYFPSG
jgi:hypothetical protein